MFSAVALILILQFIHSFDLFVSYLCVLDSNQFWFQFFIQCHLDRPAAEQLEVKNQTTLNNFHEDFTLISNRNKKETERTMADRPNEQSMDYISNGNIDTAPIGANAGNQIENMEIERNDGTCCR